MSIDMFQVLLPGGFQNWENWNRNDLVHYDDSYYPVGKYITNN